MSDQTAVPATPTTATSGGRLAALLADLAAVHPGSAVTAARPGAAAVAGQRRFRLLLSRGRPRMLVPVDLPRAARSFLRRDSANDSAAAVAGRRAVGALAGSPLAPVVFPSVVAVGPVTPASVEAHLARELGADVRLALAGGAARANAKPVLGVFRTDGTEIGYAKIGLTDLASRLVEHETATLQALAAAGLRQLDVPRVRAGGSWAGHALLLMDAVRGERGAGRTLPVDAVREIAASAGLQRSSLAASPWVGRVEARSRRAPGQVGDRLRSLLAALVQRVDGSGSPVLHGAWHGDWGPWNMAWSAGRAVVWDWERYAADVPVGLDAVHFVAHAPLRQVGDLDGARRVLVERAEPAVRDVLAQWPDQVPDPQAAASTVVDAYLLEIATRFAADAAEVHAPAVERLAGWYVEVAESRLFAPATRTGGAR